MILTAENYHSPAANIHYMSVSQFKSWDMERGGCEAATLADLRDEWTPDPKEAFIEGNFVHAWSEGKLDEFCALHPEIISSQGPTKGQLKANYKVCETMISYLKNDQKVMFYLRGQKEVIITTEMFGIPWKVKLDVLNDDLNYILDLKTAKDFSGEWVVRDGKNVKVSFIEKWGYHTQAAIFAEVERIYRGGDGWKDFFMVAVTKQDPPDHELINLSDPEMFRTELDRVHEKLPRIIAVKSGKEPPNRCGTCKYCLSTKKVSAPVWWAALQPA